MQTKTNSKWINGLKAFKSKTIKFLKENINKSSEKGCLNTTLKINKASPCFQENIQDSKKTWTIMKTIFQNTQLTRYFCPQHIKKA